jgi:hypothetical protein
MTRIYRELRESLRVFQRQPGFSSIVVLTIALGIGANTAIFSLIYGILLRPFPYREPDGLVRVQSVLTKAGGVVRPCSLADVDDIRKRNRTLVDLGAFSGSFDADIRGDGQPSRSRRQGSIPLSHSGRNRPPSSRVSEWRAHDAC